MFASVAALALAALQAPDPCTVGFTSFFDEAGVEQSCPPLSAEQQARVDRAEANVSNAYAKDVCMERDNPLACMEEGEPQ